MTYGPVILDLLGPHLLIEEREMLKHPLVGGIILFTRHYESPEQLIDLCQSIRAVRKSPILITVDHEGGRVQRFREGFTRIPSMGQLGALYDLSPSRALEMTEACAFLIASELLAAGIDLSFAPVLDLNKRNNPAIGDRAFHQHPDVIVTLAKKFVHSLQQTGMAAVGKHFPGHGSVTVDSHRDLPIDSRCFADIEQADLKTFIALIQEGIDAIMPAHILFSAVHDQPVGFSEYWLQTILRKQLNFSGVIMSDDLNMNGADAGGSYAKRAEAALDAGCNMILICNNRPAALEILDHLPREKYLVPENLFQKLRGKFTSATFEALESSKKWQEKHKLVSNFLAQEIL